MDVRSDRFLVMESKRFKLLCRDDQNLYLIPLGKTRGSDRERELRKLPADQIAARIKKLRGESIPLNTLRGIAPAGAGDGDLLYLLLEDGWRPLILRQYLSWDYLELFFPGVPQCQAPQENIRDKSAPDYWRLEEQDPVKREKLKWLGPGFALLGAAAGAWFFAAQSMPAFLLCALCVLIPLALDIFMPAYFTLGREYKYCGKTAICLLPPLALVGMGMLYARIQYLVPAFPWRLVWMSLLVAAAVCAAMMLLAREFRKHKILLAELFVWVLLLSFGFLQHANVLLPQPPPESVAVQVVDARRLRNRSYGRRFQRLYVYRCVVEQPDGTRVVVEIDETTYSSLQAGMTLEMNQYQGALGIEYFTITYTGQPEIPLNL